MASQQSLLLQAVVICVGLLVMGSQSVPAGSYSQTIRAGSIQNSSVIAATEQQSVVVETETGHQKRKDGSVGATTEQQSLVTDADKDNEKRNDSLDVSVHNKANHFSESSARADFTMVFELVTNSDFGMQFLKKNYSHLNKTVNFTVSRIPDQPEKFPCVVLPWYNTSFLSATSEVDLQWQCEIGIFYGNCSCQNNTCDCSRSNLTSVPQDLPASITELKIDTSTINMLPRDVLSRYNKLHSLSLSCNTLRRLEVGSFNGLSLLHTLDISKNNILAVPVQAFEALKSLKVLRMHGNRYQERDDYMYPDAALSAITSLEELHIDGLSNRSFGLGFRKMSSLRKLFLSSDHCTMFTLGNETFKNIDQITVLNISGCRLHGASLDTGLLSPLKNLLVLDASRNDDLGFEHLGRLMWGLVNSSLHTLIIDSIVNQHSLNCISSSLFQYVPQTLRILVARRNNVLIVEPAFFTNLPKGLKTLDMRDTTIISNVLEISQTELPALETVLLSSHQCPNDDSSIRLFTALESTFSTESDCRVRKKRWGSFIINTLKRVSVNVPKLSTGIIIGIHSLLPSSNNIETLDLCCGEVSEFDFFLLYNFEKLQNLTIRGTSVSKLIPLRTAMKSVRAFRLYSQSLDTYLRSSVAPFAFLPNLKYLDLSLNRLSYVREDLFHGLSHLEHLLLDRNEFSSFDVDISSMTKLKVLNLSSTALGQLPVRVRSAIDHLSPGQVRIDMTDCPIQCDCYNLDFLKWMADSRAFDQNFRGYKCKYLDTSVKYMSDGYKDTIRILERECAENYPMFIVVLGATMVLVFLTLGAFMYRLRWKLRYLYYVAYLKFTDKHRSNQEKQFGHDVFLSYDSRDVVVVKELSRELESRGFKLLIHSRDFVAGDYIASNIVKAVTGSRKTLVILTKNLLTSTWCKYEIEMATMEAVQTGRQVLVFLLMESIPNKDLGVDLLRYVRSNTYMPYPKQEEEEEEEDIMKNFYDKLAYDLRH